MNTSFSLTSPMLGSTLADTSEMSRSSTEAGAGAVSSLTSMTSSIAQSTLSSATSASSINFTTQAFLVVAAIARLKQIQETFKTDSSAEASTKSGVVESDPKDEKKVSAAQPFQIVETIDEAIIKYLVDLFDEAKGDQNRIEIGLKALYKVFPQYEEKLAFFSDPKKIEASAKIYFFYKMYLHKTPKIFGDNIDLLTHFTSRFEAMSALDITLPIQKIEAIFKETGIIVLRSPLSSRKLLLGCGSEPCPYSKFQSIDKIPTATSSDSDTDSDTDYSESDSDTDDDVEYYYKETPSEKAAGEISSYKWTEAELSESIAIGPEDCDFDPSDPTNYSKMHAHKGFVTIDPQLGRNPTIVGAFGTDKGVTQSLPRDFYKGLYPECMALGAKPDSFPRSTIQCMKKSFVTYVRDPLDDNSRWMAGKFEELAFYIPFNKWKMERTKS